MHAGGTLSLSVRARRTGGTPCLYLPVPDHSRAAGVCALVRTPAGVIRRRVPPGLCRVGSLAMPPYSVVYIYEYGSL